MEENFLQDDFNFDLLKELSIADLKAAMEYFYSEYKFWSDDYNHRLIEIRLCEEATTFNLGELKKLKNKTSIQKISQKKLVFNFFSEPYLDQTDLVIETKSSYHKVKSSIEYLINELTETKNIAINGDDEIESLSEIKERSDYFLDKYYLLKDELGSRFSVEKLIKGKTRFTIKTLVRLNYLKYINAPRGKKKIIIETLARENEYEPGSIRNEFRNRKKELESKQL